MNFFDSSYLPFYGLTTYDSVIPDWDFNAKTNYIQEIFAALGKRRIVAPLNKVQLFNNRSYVYWMFYEFIRKCRAINIIKASITLYEMHVSVIWSQLIFQYIFSIGQLKNSDSKWRH